LSRDATSNGFFMMFAAVALGAEIDAPGAQARSISSSARRR
jgi:hypothetical protein